ncbi:MAG: ribonuclease H-like domain-containing protein, partial [Olpidium bornovanus]
YADNRVAVGSPRWPVLAVRVARRGTLPPGRVSPLWISPKFHPADADLVTIDHALEHEDPSSLSPRLRRQFARFLLVGGLLHNRAPDWPRRVLLGCDDRKKEAILEELHDRQGHYANETSPIRVRACYFWPGVEEDVRNYVRTCDICQRQGKKRAEELPAKPQPLPDFFEVWHLDSSGTLPSSAGYRYFQLAVKRLSGWVVACRVKSRPTEETSFALVQTVVREHGAPIRMVADRGGEFGRSFRERINQCYGIQFSRTSAYNPQSNGAAERSVQEVGKVLTRLMLTYGAGWAKVFDNTVWCVNTSRRLQHSGGSAFFWKYGFEPRLPIDHRPDFAVGTAPPNAQVDYYANRLRALDELRHRRQTTLAMLLQQDHERWLERQRQRARMAPLRVGDLVLRYESWKETTWTGKLEPD